MIFGLLNGILIAGQVSNNFGEGDPIEKHKKAEADKLKAEEDKLREMEKHFLNEKVSVEEPAPAPAPQGSGAIAAKIMGCFFLGMIVLSVIVEMVKAV